MKSYPQDAIEISVVVEHFSEWMVIHHGGAPEWIVKKYSNDYKNIRLEDRPFSSDGITESRTLLMGDRLETEREFIVRIRKESI